MGQAHLLRPPISGEHKIHLRALDQRDARGAAVDDNRGRSLLAAALGASRLYLAPAVRYCLDGEELCNDLEDFREKRTPRINDCAVGFPGRQAAIAINEMFSRFLE